MKKLTKNLKKNFMKKAVVLSLAGVLLCSQSLTVAAATNTASESRSQVSAHECEFSVDLKLVSTTKVGSHIYTHSITIGPNGEDVVDERVCFIYQKLYQGTPICNKCGKTSTPVTHTVITHSSCGQ